MADDGSENFNSQVDALVDHGLLKCVLAQHDVLSSNLMIEAWWRQRWGDPRSYFGGFGASAAVVDAPGETAARTQVEEMCERLLANPVIEAYDISLQALPAP